LEGDPTRKRLTDRERAVALLVGEGLSDRAIARRLGLSPKTVANYLRHICQRLDLGSRAEIAAWVTARRMPGAHDAPLRRGRDADAN
jgi:non-specific serine/threonine protein kinase